MTDWNIVTGSSLEKLWENFILFLPEIFLALIILVIGWFFALAVGKITANILYRMKFNSFFEGEEWEEAFKKAEIKINPSDFIGSIVKWLLIIVVIWMTAERLAFHEFASLMGNIVGYLPSVIVAVLIFIVAVMVADFLSKMVMIATEKAEFPYAKTTGAIVKGSIWVFAAFAILIHLGIARDLLLALFYGIVAFLAIAGGLSFGLGGKEAAQKFIEDIKKKIK